MSGYTELDKCVVCGGGDLRDVLSLDEQPLANAFHDGGKRQEIYPLTYRVCESCHHGQLSVAVDPHILFDSYLYISGTTRTLKQYFMEFVRKVEMDFSVTAYITQADIDSGDSTRGHTNPPLKVLEIGCNDCTLLKEFDRRGHSALGVDPSASGYEHVLHEFWNDEVAEFLVGRGSAPFDAIIAMNVLAHVADPVEFLRLCKRVLAPGGRIYVQTSQAMMLLNGEFDTIYHEHVSYFTASSMKALTKRAELFVERMDYAPIHGKSMLAQLSQQPLRFEGVDVEFDLQVEGEELRMGYYAPAIYERFAELARYKKEHAIKTVDACRADGYRIVGYGAAAKGMTFLNYTGIELDAVVDDNPLKVGKLCPGNDARVMSMQEVCDRAFLSAEDKVCWLILAWNFADEIIERIRSARPDAKDLFMTCFPRSVLR